MIRDSIIHGMTTTHYLVLSRSLLDQCALHCCTPDRKTAIRMYDTVCERVAGNNAYNKHNGKKRSVVELVELPRAAEFLSDVGFAAFSGYNQERVQVLMNNVRDADASEARRGIKTRGALFVPLQISDDMCAFFDLPEKTVMSRADVSRLMNAYVRKHHLLDSADPKLVHPDARIKALYPRDFLPSKDAIFGDDRIALFDLHRKLIAHHFLQPC